MTQVILLERVEKLGAMGDLVSVRPGFARNYLLPQKKALRATKENIAYFEAKKKHLEADNEKARKDAEKRVSKFDGVKVPLIRQASESGQLFGSVTSRDIALEISAVTGEKVDRNMVRVNQNYKMLGLFPIKIALHPEVFAEVTINIARSPEESEIQARTGKALIAEDTSGKRALETRAAAKAAETEATEEPAATEAAASEDEAA